MLNREEEYTKMKKAEGQLWWYKILHEHVLETMQSVSLSKEIKVLDAGCGTGGLLRFLGKEGYTNLKGFDLSTYAVEASKFHGGYETVQLNVKDASTYFLHDYFDVIICNDVLYFLPDTELPHVVRGLLQLLNKDGILIINLPAYNVFKGMHDVSVGIRKRWTYKRFKNLVDMAPLGYRVVQYYYWPLLLAPLILCARLFQRMKMRFGAEIKSDVDVPPVVINKLFYTLTKAERFLPFRKIIGSSLFITIGR